MLRVRWPVTAIATRSGTPRTDHVPGSGATQVVEQLVGDPGSLAGGSPGLSEVSHGLTVSVEHQRRDSDVAVLLE